MIGIRLADNTVFPVFDPEQPGGKRIVLTTERDHQDRIDLEVVRDGNGDAVTVGQLSLQDLRPRSSGEPEIELVMRLESDGVINVSLYDPDTGNTTGRSMSPEHDALLSAPYAAPSELTEDFHEDLEPPEEESPRPRRRAGLLVLLALILIAAGAVLVWWTMLRPLDGLPTDDDPVPLAAEPDDATPLQDEPTERTDSSEAVPEEPAAPADSRQERDASAAEETSTAASTSAEPESPEPGSIEYRIQRGDTLWDISQAFYGTPWLYPELADANRISNPDLIFAERDLQIPDGLRQDQ